MKRFFFLFCWMLSISLSAQNDSRLTLERIFLSDEFDVHGLEEVRWIERGRKFTVLESAPGDGEVKELVQYDAKTGSRKVILDPSRLIPSGEGSPLILESYEWSSNGGRLLLFTNTKRVWRRNTRGDYWVLDIQTGNLRRIGRDFPGSSLMFAKFSPDGERVAYVYANNLYVEDLSGKNTQLTRDGSKTVINGTFDWVYEEELNLRDGFRWSPDGKWISYWQLNTEGVGIFYMINNTDSIYSRMIPIPYPKAGSTNSACRIGFVSSTGGDTRWLDIPGDPRSHYIARMDWAGNSEEIAFQVLNRHQNTNRLLLADIETGAVNTVFTDQDDAWIDVVDDCVVLEDGSFLWVSERSGFRHAYRLSRDGSGIKPITSGDWDLIEIAGIDEKGGWLYYYASPEDATQRFLYRLDLEGKGSSRRITPMSRGTHQYLFSPDFRFALHTASSFDEPPTTTLVGMPGHRIVRSFSENDRLNQPARKLDRKPVRFFRIDIGGNVALDCWEMLPPDFDPNQKYPVLFYVYGEPIGQTVRDAWGGKTFLWHLFLCQNGYVVMSVDNRGTPAPRGRDWRKCAYGQLGLLTSRDQAEAARRIRTWSYVDSSRIAVWGWSGGGSMTLNLLFRYPELYRLGMSVAPVADQRYYDSIYQERFMGLPQENENYIAGSPVTVAHRLKGDLLIVHGTGDDNVHYQNTEAVINKLILHNLPFTMMAYPNRSHSINEGDNTSLHLRSLLTRFLTSHLPPGGR